MYNEQQIGKNDNEAYFDFESNKNLNLRYQTSLQFKPGNVTSGEVRL